MTEPPRIDAHQHFWHPARGDYGWLTPALGTIHRPFAPKDLVPLLERHGIDGTVLVQAAPTVAETEYLLGIADTHSFVKGIVGWVDFTDPGAGKRDLERLAGHPKIKGFRPMIQDIADPDWVTGSGLDWAFEAIASRGLVFDALVKPHQLAALRTRLVHHPGLKVVVDHGAKPAIRERALAGWAEDIAAIARDTAAFCKLSGLVTEAGAEWCIDDLRPYTDHLLRCFGPERLVFGSDWPVVTRASSYDRWIETAGALLAGLGPAQRAAVFGGNAARLYRLAD
jgi:L-fuconolactonase